MKKSRATISKGNAVCANACEAKQKFRPLDELEDDIAYERIKSLKKEHFSCVLETDDIILESKQMREETGACRWPPHCKSQGHQEAGSELHALFSRRGMAGLAEKLPRANEPAMRNRPRGIPANSGFGKRSPVERNMKSWGPKPAESSKQAEAGYAIREDETVVRPKLVRRKSFEVDLEACRKLEEGNQEPVDLPLIIISNLCGSSLGEDNDDCRSPGREDGQLPGEQTRISTESSGFEEDSVESSTTQKAPSIDAKVVHSRESRKQSEECCRGLEDLTSGAEKCDEDRGHKDCLQRDTEDGDVLKNSRENAADDLQPQVSFQRMHLLLERDGLGRKLADCNPSMQCKPEKSASDSIRNDFVTLFKRRSKQIITAGQFPGKRDSTVARNSKGGTYSISNKQNYGMPKRSKSKAKHDWEINQSKDTGTDFGGDFKLLQINESKNKNSGEIRTVLPSFGSLKGRAFKSVGPTLTMAREVRHTWNPNNRKHTLDKEGQNTSGLFVQKSKTFVREKTRPSPVTSRSKQGDERNMTRKRAGKGITVTITNRY